MALRLVLAVPLPDILAFRKLARAYFTLAEVLAHGHTGTLAQQVRARLRGASCTRVPAVPAVPTQGAGTLARL